VNCLSLNWSQRLYCLDVLHIILVYTYNNYDIVLHQSVKIRMINSPTIRSRLTNFALPHRPAECRALIGRLDGESTENGVAVRMKTPY
jgi:hypothetical protein